MVSSNTDFGKKRICKAMLIFISNTWKVGEEFHEFPWHTSLHASIYIYTCFGKNIVIKYCLFPLKHVPLCSLYFESYCTSNFPFSTQSEHFHNMKIIIHFPIFWIENYIRQNIKTTFTPHSMLMYPHCLTL